MSRFREIRQMCTIFWKFTGPPSGSEHPPPSGINQIHPRKNALIELNLQNLHNFFTFFAQANKSENVYLN